MAATLITVLNQLVTQLQLINGTGSYTHDVSVADGVIWGAEIDPARVPRINLTDLEWRSTHETLSTYRRTVSVTLVGYVAAAADTSESRLQAAINLLNDIVLSIETDTGLSGNVTDTIIANTRAFDGQEWGLDMFGVVTATVELHFTMTTGT